MLDRALLPVDAGSDHLLVDVDLHDPQVTVDVSDWRTPTMQETATATVRFDGAVVGDHAVLGGPGFYLDRPGFWIGSVGVAAVWAGGAVAVAETLRSGVADEPHALAHLGAVDAARGRRGRCSWQRQRRSTAIPCAAGSDGDGAGTARPAPRRTGGHRDHRSVGAGTGSRTPRAGRHHARRVAELQLYLRQTHADRDLEALGRLVGGAGASGR